MLNKNCHSASTNSAEKEIFPFITHIMSTKGTLYYYSKRTALNLEYDLSQKEKRFDRMSQFLIKNALPVLLTLKDKEMYETIKPYLLELFQRYSDPLKDEELVEFCDYIIDLLYLSLGSENKQNEKVLDLFKDVTMRGDSKLSAKILIEAVNEFNETKSIVLYHVSNEIRSFIEEKVKKCASMLIPPPEEKHLSHIPRPRKDFKGLVEKVKNYERSISK